MKEPGLAVLIPVLDEEEALPGTLEVLQADGIGKVVVVDNGSRDRTVDVAGEAGATVLSEPRRGYGAACLRGIEYLSSLATPPEILVFVDGDGRGQAIRMAELVAPIMEGKADLVLGTRVPASLDGSSAVPWHARMGNRAVLFLVRLLFGRRFSDFAPFRAISFPRLQELAMDDRDWGWTVQMQIRALVHGLRIVEVPIPHTGRTAGRSKISGRLGGSLKAGGKMLLTVAREWMRRGYRDRPRAR